MPVPTANAMLRMIFISLMIVVSISGRPTFAQTSSAPVEIVELTRALRYDPDLIYEYVYNNIETLPQHGSSKGPLGALLDGKGTAFDQAELMVVLLQQAGITASYQIARIQLTASQLTNWIGTDTSANSIGHVLGSGGFPGTLTGDPVTSAQINWAWVQVDIGGTSYVFDPSTKAYNRSAGIGTAALTSALGYDPSLFLGRTESGATITSTSITGLNRSNVRSDLATFSNNLTQYIRTNTPAAATTDVIGGKSIVALTIGTQLRQTSLSYAVGAVQTQPTIPSAFRTTLTLTLGSNSTTTPFGFTALSSPITFNTSDIYNHRLVVSFNASSIPSLLLDGVAQVSASGAVPAGRQLTVKTSISHPYASTFQNITDDDTVRMTPFANFIYLIGTGWGQVGRGTIEKHRKLLQDNIAANPGNPAAESVLGESLAMIGYTWLAECAQQQQLVDQLIGTDTIYHHAVGVVGTKAVGASSGPYVDLPINGLSLIQRLARTTVALTPIESSAFFSVATFSSIAESGTLEQTQPGAVAASTVKLIDTAVQSPATQIFDINNSAVPGDTPAFYTSNIRPILATTYTAGDLTRIDSLVNSQNFRVVAPANGAISVNQYTGTGYYQITQNGDAIGSIITGGLSGGEPASPVSIPQIVDNTPQSFTPALPQSPVISQPIGVQGDAGGNVGATQTSGEPINLVTGDYLNNATDLTVGSQGMPYGLAFQRYYDSGTRSRRGPLGNGWTHNFAISISPDSDGFAGMAVNSPISGASAIAATFVILDILNTGATTAKPLDRVVIASVAQRWLMDQLIGNIVAVTQPGYVEHFTKLTDGSYNPPPGSATVLTSNAGSFQYLTKNQQILSFNTTGNLATIVDPAGPTILFNYTGSPGVLSTVTNNLGRSLNFAYAGGLLQQVSDGTGRTVSYSYDAAGNLTAVTDPIGNATTYTYDIPGRLTQIFYPASPGAAFVTNTYDLLGRVGTQASGANPPWQYFFAGARGEEIDPFGTRHVIYTTPRGKTRAEIQDLGGLNSLTVSTFDGLDRIISTTAPEGGVVTYGYDQRSNVLNTTLTPKPGSPLAAQVTIYTYDPLFNRPTTVKDRLGLVTQNSYDAGTGNLTTSISDFGPPPHLNARRNFTYNNVGQVLTATDPLGSVTQLSYDGAGNQTSIVRDAGAGRLNQLTSFSFNPVGDTVSITDPRGSITTNTYDAARRLTTTTAPNGVTISYTYDANGKLLQTQQSVSGAVLRSTSATYTLTGKVAAATDANGNVTDYAYDTLDRVSRVTDPAQRSTSFIYDALSRRTQVLNTAIQSAPLLQQSYTPDGLLGSLTDANNRVTAFAYDGLDRLATTTYPLGSTETLTYDADNNVLTRKTRANQTISFAYDTLNRLKTKTPPSPAPVVSYAYDLAGRLTGISDTSAAIAAAVPPSGTLVQYSMGLSYDAMNRPTAVTWSPAASAAAPTAGSVTFGHAYNKVNQRIGQTVTDNTWFNYPAASPSTVSYTANALNQYTAVGAVTPTYDGNGNLTSDATFTFGYDSENRLISASGAGNTASYTFDAQGRRKTKTVNGTTTVFVTDTGNREVLEYDGASGAILRWYAYGLGPNDVLGQMNVAAATRATLVPDMLGSVIATLDSGSGVLSKIGYLPYGKSGSPGPFGYTGQRIDAETSGLYYYRARHYSPAWGRFVQADPIGARAGANFYAYVGNDPLNAMDPFGLWTFQIGGSFSFNLGWIGGQVSAGIIVDGYGNAGFYGTAGGGPGVGGSVKLGASSAVTTAPRIMDTNGYNSGVSVTAGAAGGAVSGDWSHGTTRDNQIYNSYGGSLGVGGGLGVTQTNTWTKVIPMVVFDDPGSQPSGPSPQGPNGLVLSESTSSLMSNASVPTAASSQAAGSQNAPTSFGNAK